MAYKNEYSVNFCLLCNNYEPIPLSDTGICKINGEKCEGWEVKGCKDFLSTDGLKEKKNNGSNIL